MYVPTQPWRLSRRALVAAAAAALGLALLMPGGPVRVAAEVATVAV
jgi:hypothetical protein